MAIGNRARSAKRPSRDAAAHEGGPPEVPCVLHCGWLPVGERGRFALWAESANRIRRPRKSEHPFQLRSSDLFAAVENALPALQDSESISNGQSRVWAILPGEGGNPSPSIELQADLDGEISEPTAWGAWRVDAILVPDSFAPLTSSVLRHAEGLQTVRVGQDLRFWAQLADALEWVVRRHEYLPAIFAKQARKANRRGQRRKTADCEFEAG